MANQVNRANRQTYPLIQTNHSDKERKSAIVYIFGFKKLSITITSYLSESDLKIMHCVNLFFKDHFQHQIVTFTREVKHSISRVLPEEFRLKTKKCSLEKFSENPAIGNNPFAIPRIPDKSTKALIKDKDFIKKVLLNGSAYDLDNLFKAGIKPSDTIPSNYFLGSSLFSKRDHSISITEFVFMRGQKQLLDLLFKKYGVDKKEAFKKYGLAAGLVNDEPTWVDFALECNADPHASFIDPELRYDSTEGDDINRKYTPFEYVTTPAIGKTHYLNNFLKYNIFVRTNNCQCLEVIIKYCTKHRKKVSSVCNIRNINHYFDKIIRKKDVDFNAEKLELLLKFYFEGFKIDKKYSAEEFFKLYGKEYGIKIALIENKVSYIQLAFKYGADLNKTFLIGDEKHTSIQYAIKYSRLKALDALLTLGSQPINNPFYIHPIQNLSIADAKKKHPKSCAILIKNKISLNRVFSSKNEEGQLSCYVQLFDAYESVVYEPYQELLEKGISSDDVHLIKKALECGANPYFYSKKHRELNSSSGSPLQHSILTQNSQQLELFLNHSLYQMNVIRMGKNSKHDTDYYISPYDYAIQNKKYKAAESISKQANEVKCSSNKYDGRVYLAAKNNHIRWMKSLISEDVDVNNSADTCEPPLFVASQDGNREIVDVLIKAHADVNVKDKKGKTPAFISAENNHIGCLKLLINANADINEANGNNKIPAYIAAKNGHKECLQELINAKANLKKYDITHGEYQSYRCYDYSNDPVFIASINGHIECLKLLALAYERRQFLKIKEALIDDDVKQLQQALKDGFDPNTAFHYEDTPLYVATLNNSLKCLRVLIEAKGDVNQLNKYQLGPIHVASICGYKGCLQLLLLANANPNRCADMAAESGQVECAHLLIGARLAIPRMYGDKLKKYGLIAGLVEDNKEWVDAGSNKDSDLNGTITTGTGKTYSYIQYALKENRDHCIPSLLFAILRESREFVASITPLIKLLSWENVSINQVLDLKKDLNNLNSKELLKLDKEEKIKAILNAFKPIYTRYHIPLECLAIYFECIETAHDLLLAKKAPFDENTKAWKALLQLSEKKSPLRELVVHAQAFLKQMQINDRSFQRRVQELQLEQNKIQLATEHHLERRRKFFESIYALSIKIPFFDAKKNLIEKMRTMPVKELSTLSSLVDKLQLPHRLLGKPSFFNIKFLMGTRAKNSEFTVLNKLIAHMHNLQKLSSYKSVHEELSIITQCYQAFIQKMCTASDKEKALLTHPCDYMMYLANQPPLKLTSNAIQTLIPKKEGSKENQYGTHVVKAYHGIHWKKDPDAPGVEHMVHSLSNLIAGQGAPPTELVKISNGKIHHIYIASQTVKGESLDFILKKHPEFIYKVNRYNYSCMFFLGLLTNPQDAKPDNYMATLNVNEKGEVSGMHIVAIDNDLSFYPPILESNALNKKEHFVNVKNVLYFFPQMRSEVHPDLKHRISATSSASLVLKWLNSLYRKNQEYRELEKQHILTKQELQKLQLPIELPPGLERRVYEKLTLIQKLMLKEKNLTHEALFARVQPILYKYYRNIQKDYPDPMRAISKLYAMDVETVEERVNLKTRITSRSSMETAIAKRNVKRRHLEKIKKRPIKTVVESFIQELDFSTMDPDSQTKFFLDINECTFLSKLVIQNSSIINANTMQYASRHLPHLKELTLTGCDNLNKEALLPFMYSHKQLFLSVGLNRLIRVKDWQFLAERFPNFSLFMPKVNARFMINQLTPNQLLYQAIVNCPEHTAILELALLRGSKVNKLCNDNTAFKGKNALHIAATYNQLAPLKFFAKNGGNLAIKDYKGQTPLERALAADHKNSHQGVIAYLLENSN